MSEQNSNTFTAYLGPEFQLKLMWQLLVEPEFAEKTIPDLAIEYFDDPNLKRLFIIILEYFKEYEKVANLQNESVFQAIYKYKTPGNIIEEESLFGIINKIKQWNERVINRMQLYDGDAVQKETMSFIKQQEYRKLGEFILEKTKNGEIRQKYILGNIEDKIEKIGRIGLEEDQGTEVIEGIDRALRKEFRQTIATGVGVIDQVTGGGLGRGEIGLILSPSGVGKTTLLTKIANNAYDLDKKVLQIIFEDTEDQIKRKHYGIWSKVRLSEIDEKREKVAEAAYEVAKMRKAGGGVLMIKRFSQENTTMMDIRNWIIRHEKKEGYKFDIVILDYLDCIEPHKKVADRNEAELQVVKSFIALSADFDIPCWSAIQTNRSGFESEFVDAHQTGGSIKRIQKAHFFMSIAKTSDQKESGQANIKIIKARFAQDGQTFTNAIFNNDTMEIRIVDSRYPSNKAIDKSKEKTEKEVERFDRLQEEDDNSKLYAMAGAICNDISSIASDFDGKPITVGDVVDTSKLTEETHNETNNIVEDVEQTVIEEPIIEIDTSQPIEVAEIKKEDVIEDINDDTLDIISETEKKIVVEKEVTETPIVKTEVVESTQKDLTQMSSSEAEKHFVDPDMPEKYQKRLHERLFEIADNKSVVKKE